MPAHLKNATVSSLMILQGLEWDMDVLEGIFDPRDRELILKIPIARCMNNDDIIWVGEEKGNFSV